MRIAGPPTQDEGLAQPTSVVRERATSQVLIEQPAFPQENAAASSESNSASVIVSTGATTGGMPHLARRRFAKALFSASFGLGGVASLLPTSSMAARESLRFSR